MIFAWFAAGFLSAALWLFILWKEEGKITVGDLLVTLLWILGGFGMLFALFLAIIFYVVHEHGNKVLFKVLFSKKK